MCANSQVSPVIRVSMVNLESLLLETARARFENRDDAAIIGSSPESVGRFGGEAA